MALSESSNSASAVRDSDWTSRLPNTSHVQLFKEVDWAATELGPLRHWGPSLRFAANMVFADSRGACVYWGPRLTAFYNEAFKVMAQSVHPFLMGGSFDVAFPELRASIRPLFEKATADGVTVDVDHIPLFVQRDGLLEECYFTGQFIPLVGESGGFGFYNTAQESTFRVLHDRRKLVLDQITALPSISVSSTLEHVVGALELNPHDVTMLLVYSASESGTVPGTHQMTLKGSIGVPKDHQIATMRGNLHQTKFGLFWLFRKAQHQEAPMVISTSDESLKEDSTSILEDIHWAGHGEPSQNLVICPLLRGPTLFGFLVLGLNPRRPYDVPYQQFVSDVSHQLLAKLNDAISIEDSRKREEALIQDLAESEARIRDIAIHCPVGMICLDRDGTVIWGNQQYFDILGLPKEGTTNLEAVIELYHEDDLGAAVDMWEKLTQGAPYHSAEMRLKRRFIAPDGETQPVWVLVHGFCSREEGKAKYIMACLTDISRLKWAESIQSRNAIAAQEAKRRQEEFIDLISHELRNPLGAMAIGAETIAKCLTSSKTPEATDVLEILYENVHIAETILACASHQKRIIDDVLLLSRLESLTLTIAPVQTTLETLVENARRMFSGECKQYDITLQVNQHQSYSDLKANAVMCDPSRLMQIIINILANGIKFVRPESNRQILLTWGAATTAQEVRAFNSAIRWCPSSEIAKEEDDITTAPEWGQGEPLYVFFAVQDSGPGIGHQEIDHLFKRFAQTSKLTHVHYGGSGLGLYISRELAEKHGGEIGIASQKGAGATFMVYIKTKRATPESRPSSKADLASHFDRAQQQQPHPTSPGQNLKAHDSPTSKTKPPSSSNKLQILLAEDNLVNQKFMARGLERNDYTVHVANHGQEVMDILKQTRFWNEGMPSLPLNANTNAITDPTPQHPTPPPLHIDLILMDWEMPIMDGLTASKLIRQHEMSRNNKNLNNNINITNGTSPITTHQIPIIGITANARQEQIQLALDAGMDDVLPKPFLVSEMVGKVEEWRGRIEGWGR